MRRSSGKMTPGKKILLSLLLFFVVAGTAVYFWISFYLTPLVKKRLTDVIVNGSDSLYRVDMGKFDLSFWGGSADIGDLNIRIDSNVYKKMKALNTLPALTTELKLHRGSIKGMDLRSLVFSKKMMIDVIIVDSAELQLVRHFKNSRDPMSTGTPLWKLIQPRLRSIDIGLLSAGNVKINYRNSDSATAFHWQLERSQINAFDIRVDSTATYDSSRLLFAKNIAFRINGIKLNTIDGLYQVQTGGISYSTGERTLQIKELALLPVAGKRQFTRHYGYGHEMYQLAIPLTEAKGFMLSRWITDNRLQASVVELSSPVIKVSLDRNEKANPHSKKGKYPQQLLQKAGYVIQINKLITRNARVSYTETSSVTSRTGNVNFSSLESTIDNITNDPLILQQKPSCVAVIRGTVMQTGSLHTVFRFDLADRLGGFSVKAVIGKLGASQLRPLFKAMTAVELQTFNIQRLDYAVSGNENTATGALSMKYDNMDILINTVSDDKSFDKKGLLSFLANRVLIYKENPMKDEAERKANGVFLQRDASRSFFNLIWKLMFTAAGEIVLRPFAKNRIEKKKERELRRTERKQERRARQVEKLTSKEGI